MHVVEIFKERSGDAGLKAINPGQPAISPLCLSNPLPTAAASDRKEGKCELDTSKINNK